MRIVPSLFTLLAVTGCPGTAPPDQNATPDADVDADVTPTGLVLSGKALDYFGAVALGDAALETDGLEPKATMTSATDGAYMVEVAVGSKFYVVGSKTGYRNTRNTPITVSDMALSQDVYLMSVQDIQNQYTSINSPTPVAGTAFVTAELRRNNNTALEVPLASVQLLDGNNVVVTGVKGPYAYNSAGNVDMAATTVAAFGGRARIAYFDVPPGTYTLSVTYQNAQNQPVTNTTSLTTIADGATLALSGGMQGPGMGNGVTDPSFATHIYPKLQRAAQGGLGCANCHTLSGPAAVLKYDDPAATVLANMKAATGVINTTTPADSLLLKRPLYEQPPTAQDHPNATFIDVNDADYKLFLLWITNGAKP
ncbi:MAG TPA: hypothetical protein VMZ53_26425 [Kofleriaceae bacterium]|nr:hypothetical protein [Kofleriaceae bacterium]